MKKKTLSKIATFGLASTLLIPSTAAFAETPSNNENIKQQTQEEIQNIKPSIEVFDKDGNLIKSYSDEEITALQNEIPPLPNIHNLVESAEETSAQSGQQFYYSFDQNGILVDSNDDNLVEQQKNIIQYGITYSFGKTSFKNHLWIGGVKTFNGPKSVILNPAKSNQKIAVRVYTSSSTYIGQVSAHGFSTETNIPITHLTKSGSAYKLQLQNNSSSTAELSGGHVFN